MNKQRKIDLYTWKARVEPALVVVLPVGLSVLLWFPLGDLVWGILWTFFVWCGGVTLIAQSTRYLGKRNEIRLFQKWNGMPTIRLLRHRENNNQVTVSRYHKNVERLLPDLKVPSKPDELANPKHADRVYESFSMFLCEKTRDKNKFPLVFEENCNYGFRRNVFGLKTIGILSSLTGVCMVIVYLWFFNQPFSGFKDFILPVVIGLLNLLNFTGWIFIFTTDWVKAAADSYAERLLAASDQL